MASLSRAEELKMAVNSERGEEPGPGQTEQGPPILTREERERGNWHRRRRPRPGHQKWMRRARPSRGRGGGSSKSR